MRFLGGMAAAIIVGGGLLVSSQAFALCSVPAEPEPEPPPTHVRTPTPVPTYGASSTTSDPGGNAVGNGAGTASYANTQVVVAPTERAAADRAEWCRRSGRSQASMDACLKAVANR